MATSLPYPEADYLVPDIENLVEDKVVIKQKLDVTSNGNDDQFPEICVVNGEVVLQHNESSEDPNDSSSKTDKDGEQNKDDEKKEKQMVSLGQLFKFADKGEVILMVLGSIFAIGNGLAQPLSFIIFGKLISKFIEFGSNINNRNFAKAQNITMKAVPILDIEKEMTTFAAYYCYIGIGMLICSYVQTAFWSLSSVRQAHRIRISFFRSILRQEIGWFDTNDSGELSTRLTDDVTKIQTGIGDKVGMLIQSITMFLSGFILGFVYGWKLTLVILSLTPALVVSAGIMGKVLGSSTEKEQTAYAKAGSVAEEVLGAIRTVVAFGGETREFERYRTHLADAEKAGIKKGISSGIAFGLFHVIMFSCYALAFWYGSKLILDNELQGGDLLIVFFCVMVGAAQMGQAGPNMEALANARGAAYTVYQVIDRVPEIDALSNEGETLESITGNIDFQKVHFYYPSRPDVKVLNGLSLSIQSGQTVALVGESGCGKSTVIKLIQRFYDTEAGQVIVDGTDIKELNVAWMRKHIGIVNQEPVLFEASIADNIRMGKDDATQEEIELAAKNANAHDFVVALPKKYDTFVGEGGAQLSGGQKQRIAIARALVGDPKILLLDEATSALDTESESVVQAALEKASQGRTTVIIAHRLSTVRNADMIAAVQGGVIAETGTHDDLLEKKGVYYRLVMLQTFAEQAEEEGGEEEEGETFINKAEKEARKAEKFMRSISVLSSGSEDEHESLKQLEMALTRKLSAGKVKTPEIIEKQKVEEKKEEIPEEEEEVAEPSIVRVMKISTPEWAYLLFGSIFSAIVGAFPVVFAIILSEILGVFALADKTEMKSEARFWSLMFLALGLSDGISLSVSSYLFAKAGEALTKRLREMAFMAMLQQEIGYFDEPAHGTGALTTRLAADATAVQGVTSTRLSVMVQVVVMGLSALIIAFIYQWKLTLLILAFVPLLLFAGAVQIRLFKGSVEEERDSLVQAGAVATEAIINIRTVASLNKESFFIDKYLGLVVSPYRKAQRRSHIFGLSFGWAGAIMFFCNAAAFRFGGYLVARNEVQFADMFKVVFAVTFGALISGEIASFAPDYAKAKMSAGRLFELFDRIPAIAAHSEEGKVPSQLEGTVEFSSVTFNYPNRPDVPVLRGLDVKIKPGQTLALVGSSGCGKSTSVSLVERFYDVAEGKLTIDGEDIKDLNLKWLRSKIGIVSQEPVLFDCSIRDNIAYGINQDERDVFEDDIISAAKKANIHNFINTLPKGYDTKVGDKGTLISGGQKQRIAIARALIRNPSVLLLDEATSALDSESEKVVQEALDVAMQGRTSIVIAHRLSTIQNADVIAVMQAGKIVELGTHQELISQKGAYYLLNTAQL